MADRLAELTLIAAKAREISSLEERTAYLEQACSNDRDLLASVRALLEPEDVTFIYSELERTTSNANVMPPDDGRVEPVDEVAEAGVVRHGDRAGEAAQALPSLTVPGYEITEILGRGGMGVVYKARHLRLKRWVALKVIRATEADEEGLARFRSEAEAVARLQHPNIVQIYEIGGLDGQPYITFELIAGGTLADHVGHAPISNREAAEIVESLARAIHHAHGQGIIHRDLKPANVLLASYPAPASHREHRSSHDKSHSGISSSLHAVGQTSMGLVPKITDFGLAKQLDAENDITGTGAVLGTPNYMAPEQASGNRQIGPAADVYSLGAILYFLLTGHPPFRGKTPLETVLMVQSQDPEPLRNPDRKIARDLEKICMKCLEKEPQKRYASAEELADDLRRFLDDEPVRATAPSSLYRLRKFVARRRGAVLSATAVLVLLVGGALASLFVTASARQRTREMNRLSDIKLLAQLKDEYAGLPEVDYWVRRETMDRWLDRADQLAGRLPQHQEALTALRAHDMAEKSPDRQDSVAQSGSTTARLERENLEMLVHGIESLMDADAMLARVREWARLTPSDAQIREAWTEHIAATEREYNVRLHRQEGLFPLGRNPRTRLWEFADLRFGLAPARDDDGDLVVGDKTGFVFVLLPGGRFRMGSPTDESGRKEEELPHDVVVSRLMISKYEITQAQWEKVMRQNPSETVGRNHPVGSVSWIDAEAFCRKTGLRLPTEAQWEYACRAGTTGPYSSTTPLDELGWHSENAEGSIHPVGQKSPNPFGLYDMHGNVLEFCQDAYSPDFYLESEIPQHDPINEQVSSGHRVLRGGSYEGRPAYLRSADRYHETPDLRWRGFGIRPTRPIDSGPDPVSPSPTSRRVTD